MKVDEMNGHPWHIWIKQRRRRSRKKSSNRVSSLRKTLFFHHGRRTNRSTGNNSTHSKPAPICCPSFSDICSSMFSVCFSERSGRASMEQEIQCYLSEVARDQCRDREDPPPSAHSGAAAEILHGKRVCSWWAGGGERVAAEGTTSCSEWFPRYYAIPNS